MGDFDDYLDQLRAALDVTPKRAGEICQEARSHLNARAGELAAAGLGLEDAAAKAIGEFGEPKAVAAQLSQANHRYRLANRFGAVLGFMIVLVSMFAVSLFWQGPVFALMGTHYSLETLPIHLLTTYAHLPFAEAKSLFGLLVLLPAAVSAGMLAGRRRWWVAGIPPVFLSGVLTPLLWLATRNLNPPVNLDLVDIVRRTLVSSLVMAGCGYLGPRVLGRGIVSWLVGVICGGYVALIGLWISSLMLIGVVHGGSSVWSLVILTAGLIVLVLGTLAYRDRRISA